ncbi:YybS family protein [bacterium 210820-DFI.6.37]|nr:YybS family protein [bacterium 210820-DFI.6.37]
MYLTLMLLAAVILPVPVLTASMKKSVTPFRAVLEGVIAGAVGVVFIMILAAAAGNNIFDTLQDNTSYMAELLAGDPNMTALLGSDTTLAQRTKALNELYGQAAQLLPSSICIIAAVASYVEYILLSKVVKWNGTRAIPMTRFRDFDLPRNVVLGWLILFALSWIITKTGIMSSDIVYVNINALFNFAFSLQGISVLFMFCHKKRAPKAIAVIIIIFFLLSNLGKMMLMLLGFADVLFRLKERLK